jgi:hypothetical protein
MSGLSFESNSQELQSKDIIAQRIARRAIKRADRGANSLIIKGGRLGIARTFHDESTYANVAKKLAPKGIEVRVDRVLSMQYMDFAPNGLERVGLADVMVFDPAEETAPSRDPKDYDFKGILARFSESAHHYEVEQIYPPAIK